MSSSFTLADLQSAVKTGAAIRCRTKLQPAGGEGDKVFPPTYAGAVYAMEKRIVPGSENPVRCVLLDSVQSQANRAEEALQDAVDEGRISIPIVEVDFSEIPIVPPGSSDPGLYEPIGRVTSLEAPHRIADAILRDSELNGVPFRTSEEGKKINLATLRNATPLFELCPTALVYGIWDSTGPKGGLGVKFQRAVVSEVIGIDASLGVKTSSRMDPLAIKAAATIYARNNADGGLDWTDDPTDPMVLKDKKKEAMLYARSGGQGDAGKPSKANHSNIPPQLSSKGEDPLGANGEKVYLSGGVTIKYAEQTTVVSLPALRRLKFPTTSNPKSDSDTNLAAQTVLAALGLCGAVLAAERGLDLRSRCLLIPSEKTQWELLGGDGDGKKTFHLTGDQAIQLLNEAITAAKAKNLPWREAPLTLQPAKQLVGLVRKSQEIAVANGGEAGDGE